MANLALSSLEELVRSAPASRVERDASIQRFEYSVEAVWKTAQRYLEIIEGLTVGSPKSCIRSSREVALLDEEQATRGLEMIDHRNLTVHTYNEKLAEEIRAALPGYARLLRAWLDAIGARLG